MANTDFTGQPITRYTTMAQITEHYWIRKRRDSAYDLIDENAVIMSGDLSLETAIARAHHYEERHAARLERIAEQQRVRAEEEAAEAARIANLPANPATARQLDYIQTLINRRNRDGEGGGFMSIPADLSVLTKVQASLLIDSLTGNY